MVRRLNSVIREGQITGQGDYIMEIVSSGDTRSLLLPGHSQVISSISKDSQIILTYNFIITTFDCQSNSQGGGISARTLMVSISARHQGNCWRTVAQMLIQQTNISTRLICI